MRHRSVRPGIFPLRRAASTAREWDAGMQRFIAHENIKRFTQQLASCSDERQRETLKQLLAAEEAKLNELKGSAASRPLKPGH